jgi:hypothetical protein
LYRISGTYFYGHKNPSEKTFPDMVFPRPAWAEDGYDRSVPSSILQQGIINRVGGSAGGSSSNKRPLLTGFVVQR